MGVKRSFEEIDYRSNIDSKDLQEKFSYIKELVAKSINSWNYVRDKQDILNKANKYINNHTNSYIRRLERHIDELKTSLEEDTVESHIFIDDMFDSKYLIDTDNIEITNGVAHLKEISKSNELPLSENEYGDNILSKYVDITVNGNNDKLLRTVPADGIWVDSFDYGDDIKIRVDTKKIMSSKMNVIKIDPVPWLTKINYIKYKSTNGTLKDLPGFVESSGNVYHLFSITDFNNLIEFKISGPRDIDDTSKQIGGLSNLEIYQANFADIGELVFKLGSDVTDTIDFIRSFKANYIWSGPSFHTDRYITFPIEFIITNSNEKVIEDASSYSEFYNSTNDTFPLDIPFDIPDSDEIYLHVVLNNINGFSALFQNFKLVC